MGADLIAYILVGPGRITRARAQKATTAMRAWVKKHKNVVVCDNCGTLQAAERLERAKDGTLLLDDVDCEDCGACELTTVAEKYPDGAAVRRALEGAVAEWHAAPGYRDSASRYNPDNPKEIIVCCGELSWGDEPGGAGYTALKAVCQLPGSVREILGIR
jgi:hypothetical protein